MFFSHYIIKLNSLFTWEPPLLKTHVHFRRDAAEQLWKELRRVGWQHRWSFAGELVAALRANDPDAFRGLLFEGIQELGMSEMEELLLEWLYSLLTAEEQDRLMGWHLGVSLSANGG